MSIDRAFPLGEVEYVGGSKDGQHGRERLTPMKSYCSVKIHDKPVDDGSIGTARWSESYRLDQSDGRNVYRLVAE